jgi:hypothetical protein
MHVPCFIEVLIHIYVLSVVQVYNVTYIINLLLRNACTAFFEYTYVLSVV